MNSTTNTPITTLRQHLVQLAGGLRLPPVAAALQEAGLDPFIGRGAFLVEVLERCGGGRR